MSDHDDDELTDESGNCLTCYRGFYGLDEESTDRLDGCLEPGSKECLRTALRMQTLRAEEAELHLKRLKELVGKWRASIDADVRAFDEWAPQSWRETVEEES